MALQRGSAIHQAIEDYHNGKSWKKGVSKFSKEFYKNTMKEEIIEFGDIPKMVYALCDNYFYYYDDKEDDMEYVKNEYHFEFPLCKDITIEGYLDSVIKIGNKIWTKETKTFKTLPDRNFLIFNRQSAIYTWALQHEYEGVNGTIWDIVKAVTPNRPELTQKGVLSQKKIASTPLELERGIIDLGLDPKKYQDYIHSVRFEDFFMRYPIRIEQKVVDNVMADTIAIAEIIRDKGPTHKHKNMSRNCSFCDYKSICQAELLGHDVEFIKKAEYKPKEERDNGKENKKQSKVKVKFDRG